MGVTPEERMARMETELAALKLLIAEQFAALNIRLDESLVSQVRSIGKRVFTVEADVRDLRESAAREDGKRAGSKAVLAGLLMVVSALSTALGTVISKFF